jgi:hypothetical protein
MPRLLRCSSQIFIAAIVTVLGVNLAPSILFASPEFPWIRQKTDTDCGRAALASLIAGLRGGNVNEIYSRIRAPRNRSTGYAIEELISAAADLNERTRVKLNRESPESVVILGKCSPYPDYFRHLHKIVADGSPVIVPTKPKGQPNHYLLLIGSDGKHFTVLDPAEPGKETMSSDRLSRVMCPLGYQALSSEVF